MYTVDDIRNITFTKTLGGYKTSEVDDFIDNCADTVAALTKTNEELKKKLELLANKVVEYRQDEDSIRTALLSAQRMGDTVLREANHKAGLILDDARIKAEKTEEAAKQQIEEQLEELTRLKKLVSDFKTQVLGVYREHLSLINVLPEYKEEETAADGDAPEPETEKEQAEPDGGETASVAEETAVPTAEEAEVAVPAGDAETVQPVETMDEEPLPLLSERFSDLKFGADYSIADDVDDEEEDYRRALYRNKK